MKQFRLLLTLFALILGWTNVSAQEDITSQYLANADLSTTDYGWTYFSDTYKYQQWRTGNETLSAAVEFYAGWGSLEHEDFMFSQTITLPAGDYRISVNAFYREGNNGNGTNDNKAWIFAGDKKQNVQALNSMGDLSSWNSAGDDMNKAMAAFKDGQFSNAFDFSLEAETEISLGFQGKFTTIYSWCILGPVKLYKYSLNDYLIDYRAKVAEAEALYEQKMNADVLTALQTAVVDESSFNVSSQVTAAIANLTAKINDANNSIQKYTELKNYIDAIAAKTELLDADGKAAYDTAAADAIAAYENGTATDGTAQMTTLDNAFKAGVLATKQPGNGLDMTAYITNADFNTGSSDPWKKETPFGGNCQIQGGSRMEYWAGNASNRSQASFNIYQELSNLPAGAYTVSADMYNSLNGEGGDYSVFSPTCGVYGLSSNEAIALVTEEGETLTTYTTGEVLVFSGNMTVGTKNSVTPMAARWFMFDNVKLTYARQLTEEEIAAMQVPTSITLSETNLSLFTGDHSTLSATVLPENASDKTITWATSDENVVTVDNGHLYAVGAGSAIITVTSVADQNVTATASITVQNDVTIIENGYYFLRDAQGRYVGRGSSYNTRAIMEEFGLPVYVETSETGLTTFTFADSNQKLFDAGSGTVYTDNTLNPYWKIKATEGGYLIINKNNNGSYDKKLGTDGGTWMQSNDNGLVWIFEPASEHNPHMTALKDKQAKEVAQTAGITAETKAALNEILNSNEYMAEKIDIEAVPWDEKYQVSAGTEGAGNGVKYYENSINGLKPGLYKLTAKAYYRLTWPETVEAAGGAPGNVYLYGNGVKTQLYSVFDFPAEVAWGGDYKGTDGKFYPNNPSSSKAAFNAGNYENELFVYVNADEEAETGTLSYGIHQPSRFGANGQWCAYQDFTLTRYSTEVDADAIAALIASIPTDAMSKENKEAIAAAKAALEAEANVVNYNALDAAISAAAPSIEAYKTYAYYIEAFKANNADAVLDIEGKYDEGVIESVEAIVAEFRTNVLAMLSTETVTDYTTVVINPGFETGPFLVNNVTGWEVNKNAGEAFASNSNGGRAFTPGYVGEGLFNTWNGSEYWLRQNLGVLPKGAYRMTAYVASAEGNEFTIKAGTGSTTITTTAGNVGTPVSVTFVSDGTTASAIDITTDKWFKADDFHLTLIGSELVDASTLAEKVAEIAESLGFEEGEYAPYNNVESMKALEAIAETVLNAEGQIGNYETVAITEAINTLTWTPNTEEVNAFFDGSFASEYSHEGNVMPIGWHGVGDKDNATNVRLMWNVESNAGLNATSSKQAAFAKFTAEYGTEVGYTLPLKAGVYDLKFIYGGWNEVGTRDIKVYNTENDAVVAPVTITAKDNQAHNTADSWSNYEGTVTIPADGNYVFSFYRENTNNQNQLVFSDITLYKAKAKKGDVNGDGNVNVADVTALVNALQPEAEKPAAADVDGDSDVDADDVKALVDLILHNE